MDLYNALGIEKSADSREIKKAYFNLAKTHHPDKGGDAERFKQIQRAYDVLSDDGKRSFYDQTGQVPGENGAPSEGGMPGGFPFDIGGLGGLGGLFGGMFGGMPGGPFGPRGGGGPPSSRRRGKAPPKVHELSLSLADFYKGKMLKVNFERQRFCKSCRGDGYTNASPCDQCGGAGMTMIGIQVGPGMIMQTQAPCAHCKGSGRKPGPSCTSCNGRCFTNEENVLNVVIEPGMKVGEKLVFTGECSDHQDFAEAGDVQFQLGEAEESIPWTRDGTTLKSSLSLTLIDSLLGSTHTISNHPGFPDGCVVVVPPGSLHGHVITVKDAGMPVRGTNRKGDALITLQVRLDTIEAAAIQKHKELLRSILKSGGT